VLNSSHLQHIKSAISQNGAIAKSWIAPQNQYTVNSQYQQAKISYLQALAQRFQDTMAVFIALGGGWDTTIKTPQPPLSKNIELLNASCRVFY
jgi:outer membrane protein TolC